MNARLLFKDCTLLHADGRVDAGMAVSVVDGRIEALRPDVEATPLPGDWWIDAGGRALAAGLFDCHARLPGVVRTQALSEADVESLTAHVLAEGLLRGITTRVLQLDAKTPVVPLLEAQSRAAASVGARALFSVAPSESDGPELALAQLAATTAFARHLASHPQQRALTGWRGPIPSDAGLQAQVHAALAGAGTEAVLDHEALPSGSSTTPNPSLRAPNWLELKSIVVGGETFDAEARARIGAAGSLMALGPSARPAPAVLEEAAPLGLSSGAVPSGLCRAAWNLASAAEEADLPATRRAALLTRALVQAPAAWMSERFGVPLGRLEAGAAADLVLYDWVPPVRPGPVAWRWDERLAARVSWTVVEGRVVVREGALLGPDGGALARAAATVLARLDGDAA